MSRSVGAKRCNGSNGVRLRRHPIVLICVVRRRGLTPTFLLSGGFAHREDRRIERRLACLDGWRRWPRLCDRREEQGGRECSGTQAEQEPEQGGRQQIMKG